MDRQVLAAYLPAELARRVHRQAKASRRSLRSVIAEGVAAYFERLDLIETIDREALLQQTARLVAASRRDLQDPQPRLPLEETGPVW